MKTKKKNNPTHVIFGPYLKDKTKAQKYCDEKNKKTRLYQWVVDSGMGYHAAVKLRKKKKKSR